MHPDLVTLLDADNQAARLVADAERQVEARLRDARERHDANCARRRQEEQRTTDALIQTIESASRQQAAERRAARERHRQASRLTADAVHAAGVEAYVAVVSGRPRKPAGEP